MINETVLALLEGGEPTEGDWTLTVTKDGLVGVEIPGGHSLYYDMEGSCPECLANMRLIAASKKLLAVTQELFDLLEEAEPSWYLRSHYNKVTTVLKEARG